MSVVIEHKAIGDLECFIEENPTSAEAVYTLGQMMLAEGNLDRADVLTTQAIVLWNKQIELLGKDDAAQPAVRKLQDNVAEAYINLGSVFYKKGETDYALKAYGLSCQMNPDNAAPYHNAAHILMEKGQIGSAMLHYEKAIQLEPDNPMYYASLASACSHAGKSEETIRWAKKALEVDPDYTAAKAALFYEYYSMEDVQRTLDYGKSITGECNGDPTLLAIKINMALFLPEVPASRSAIQKIRDRFSQGIDYILKDKITLAMGNYIVLNNFNLAYHGLDNKDLLIKTAVFYRKLYPQINYTAPNVRTQLRETKRRIGFVSRFFFNHSVSRCYGGLVEQLAKTGDFDVYIFSSSDVVDDTFSRTASACSYVQIPKNIDKARQIISSYELDTLTYLDIGMDKFTYYLAFSRLAPVQCAVAGHPETSGIDTVDYFLSSGVIEPENAQKNYSEKLIGLDHLPVYIKKTAIPDTFASRAMLGLSEDCTYYTCPMLIHKLHPDFDEAVGDILRKDPKARVILFKMQDGKWHNSLIRRLENNIPDVIERVVLFPFIPETTKFMSLLHHVDAVLDSFHFAGGSTDYMLFSMGVPLVTLPGKFMRGRTGYYLYQKMGITDLIANDKDHYVELAIKLANDKKFYASMQEKILACNRVLYENDAAVEEVANFMKTVEL